MRQREKRAFAWAWEFQAIDGDWCLCRWSEPSPVMLNDPNKKPADGARKVLVELVPVKKAVRKRYGYPVQGLSRGR